MAKLYRCYNCTDATDMPGKDFAADLPKCPYCGLDGSPGTRFENRIVQLRAIHFDPPHPTVKNAGTGLPACGRPRVGNMAMSGDPDAVNCPACRESAAWKERKRLKDSGPDDVELPGDFHLHIDLANEKLVTPKE
jgi:hypothetical protein